MARALSPAEVLRVPWVAAAHALATDQESLAWLIEALARLVVRLQDRLQAALGERVPARVVAALKELAEASGRPASGGGGIPVSQEVLAAMAGATRESVNRALRDLRRAGLVRHMAGRYVAGGSAGGGE